MRTRLRLPLFVKMMVPLLSLLLLAVALSGYLIYEDGNRRWQAEIDTRLEALAINAAEQVDVAALEAVRVPADMDGDAYAVVEAQLDQAVAAGNLAWAGIYRREGDYFYYWVEVGSSGVGYPFFYATPDHYSAYDRAEVRRVAYTDEFGSYFGFDAPIVVQDAGGERVIGLVEVLKAGEAHELLERATWERVLTILLAGSGAAVGFSLLVTTFAFSRPLKRLQHGALALAAGDLGTHIALRSRDELADLAEAFNVMSAQLKLRYEEIQQRNTELQAVYEIAQAITASSAEPEAALATILERVQEMIPYDRGEVCLYVEAARALRVRAWRGSLDAGKTRGHEYPLGKGFAGWAGKERRSLLVADTQHPPALDGLEPSAHDALMPSSYAAVPLVVGERLVGTLQIAAAGTGRFDERALRLLETIALQAAVAIETAQRVEEREQRLQSQIAQLRIEIDRGKQQRQVSEITETDFFRDLQAKARGMRNKGTPPPESQ